MSQAAAKTLAEMTWKEAEDAFAADLCVALLPVGATEQHGYHLPLYTDTIMVEEICRRLANRIDGLVVAPAIPFGTSHNHISYKGTLNLSLDVLKSVVVEIGQELVRNGADIVLIVNGHGGNTQAVAAAAYDLRQRCPQAVIAQVMWATMITEAWGVLEKNISWHADESETSLMLELAPHHVDMGRAVDDPPATLPFFEFTEEALAATKIDLGLPRTEAITPSGTIGYAKLGTREKGQAIVNEALDNLAAAIENLRKHHAVLAPALSSATRNG